MRLRQSITQVRSNPRTCGPLGVNVVKGRRCGTSVLLCRNGMFFLVVVLRPTTRLLRERTRRLRLFRRVITSVVMRLTLCLRRFNFQLLQGKVTGITTGSFLPVVRSITRRRMRPIERYVGHPRERGYRGPRTHVDRPVSGF